MNKLGNNFKKIVIFLFIQMGNFEFIADKYNFKKIKKNNYIKSLNLKIS